MKKRDLIVIWIDYYNSRLGRRQGRRVPLSLAARNVTLDDLRRAAEAAGLRVVAAREARRPGRPGERSGYIQVQKAEGASKQSIVREVAKSLMRLRGSSG
ncbi:MAG: signal recognition particle subunit SRP19/SEC65 family protein [Conexivisphaera sp.]